MLHGVAGPADDGARERRDPRKTMALSMGSHLQSASSASLQRFEEVSRVAEDRIAHFRNDTTRAAVAAGGLPAQEALSSLSWVAAMLLSTADDALKAKHTLAVASGRAASDQNQRLEHALAEAQRELDAAASERDLLREETQQLGSRMRKEGLATRKRQAKDAARIQALTEQAAQLQANLRLSESAWAEERRAEQAVGAQRERNFQSVIVKLQHEVDALASTPAKPKEEMETGGVESPKQQAPEVPEDLAAAQSRIAELQAQCDRGVALVEKLKLRLEREAKEKEVMKRKEGELQASLRAAQKEAEKGQQQLRQAAQHAQMQSKKTRESTEKSARVRHESEVQILVDEIDALQGKAQENEGKYKFAKEELRMANRRIEELHAANDRMAAEVDAARADAEARAASAVASAVASADEAQKASSGTVALLKAALFESQRRLQATQKALDAVNNPPPSAAPVPSPAAPSAAETPTAAEEEAMEEEAEAAPGLGRLRASLLDSLRAERSKLERERVLLGK